MHYRVSHQTYTLIAVLGLLSFSNGQAQCDTPSKNCIDCYNQNWQSFETCDFGAAQLPNPPNMFQCADPSGDDNGVFCWPPVGVSYSGTATIPASPSATSDSPKNHAALPTITGPGAPGYPGITFGWGGIGLQQYACNSPCATQTFDLVLVGAKPNIVGYVSKATVKPGDQALVGSELPFAMGVMFPNDDEGNVTFQYPAGPGVEGGEIFTSGDKGHCSGDNNPGVYAGGNRNMNCGFTLAEPADEKTCGHCSG